MKKKIVGIFICMLLIVTAVSTTVNSEDNNQVSKENNNFENCGCGVTNDGKYRFRLMDERPISINLDKTSIKPAIIETPDYFNWMDFEGQDWTTSAKDQRECGSCWDFAALGALESVINIREGRADLDVDLSEQYVLSCLPRAGNCIGGEGYPVFYYIMSNKSSGNNCNGIIPEFCFPYRSTDPNGFNGLDYENDPVLCDEKCENWEDYLIPISDCGKWYPDGTSEGIEAIKTQIMQTGPVATSFMATWYIHEKDNLIDWGFKNHDPDDYFSSPLQFGMTNHLVVIVGWKDDPSIENGGYWICKNEWGTIWGFNGFFNIEYGSLRIDSTDIIWVDYNPDVVVNWMPTADAGGIYYGDVGYEIMFDASESFDHEGEIVSYLWDFGDGYNDYGITVVHTYESDGAYPIKLTVRDNDGNTVNDTTWAFIGRLNDPPSTPTVDGPPEGKKGIKYDYNFSSIDSDGDDIYYYIHWGDCYIEEWIGPFSSGEVVTVNHTWNDKATFAISVKAKDKYDFYSDWANLEVIMPKNKPFNYNNINWLFERFPNAFPILKNLLKITLEGNYEKLILQEVE